MAMVSWSLFMSEYVKTLAKTLVVRRFSGLQLPSSVNNRQECINTNCADKWWCGHVRHTCTGSKESGAKLRREYNNNNKRNKSGPVFSPIEQHTVQARCPSLGWGGLVVLNVPRLQHTAYLQVRVCIDHRGLRDPPDAVQPCQASGPYAGGLLRSYKDKPTVPDCPHTAVLRQVT